MLDKKKKRSSSTSSVTRQEWGHHQLQQLQQLQQVSDRKTDLEKLYRGETSGGTGQLELQQQQVYWNGKLGGAGGGAGGGGGYQHQPDSAGQSDGLEAYQQPGGEVERFYWNAKVPGGEGGQGAQDQAHKETKGPGDQNTARKPKLNGLREFQNFNDEEKLYLFSSATQGGLSTASNSAGAAVKQNTEEKLAWSGSASSQAALYRSYLQSYEASR